MKRSRWIASLVLVVATVVVMAGLIIVPLSRGNLATAGVFGGIAVLLFLSSLASYVGADYKCDESPYPGAEGKGWWHGPSGDDPDHDMDGVPPRAGAFWRWRRKYVVVCAVVALLVMALILVFLLL